MESNAGQQQWYEGGHPRSRRKTAAEERGTYSPPPRGDTHSTEIVKKYL